MTAGSTAGSRSGWTAGATPAGRSAGPSAAGPRLACRHRVRRLANALNGSTALGLLVARLGGARVRPGPHGAVLAHGYRWPVPPAVAFTVGDVVLTRRSDGYFDSRPALLAHELRHTAQYAWSLGLPMLPAYLVAAAWSWLRTGDAASGNVFERRAGLADGGYRERPPTGLVARLRPAPGSRDRVGV